MIIRILLLALFLSSVNANAEIKINASDSCRYKSIKINKFIVSENNTKLFYKSNNEIIKLAEASKGVLVGGFRSFMISNNIETFDGKWIEIDEIYASDINSSKPEIIDHVSYYLPLGRILTPIDLDLNLNWELKGFFFDYNVNIKNSKSKEWQFYFKNRITKAVISFTATEVEKKLLASCEFMGKH